MTDTALIDALATVMSAPGCRADVPILERDFVAKLVRQRGYIAVSAHDRLILNQLIDKYLPPAVCAAWRGGYVLTT